MHTFQKVRLEVNLKDVTTETLHGIIERKYMNTLSVFDIEALVNVDKIAKFDAQVVAGNFVHLDSPLLNVIGAQADENSISALLSTSEKV